MGYMDNKPLLILAYGLSRGQGEVWFKRFLTGALGTIPLRPPPQRAALRPGAALSGIMSALGVKGLLKGRKYPRKATDPLQRLPFGYR